MLRLTLSGLFFSKKSNKEIFSSIHFPSHLIPDHLREYNREKETYEILNSDPKNATLETQLSDFVKTQEKIAKQIEDLKLLLETVCYSNNRELMDSGCKEPIPSVFLDPVAECIMTCPVILNKGLIDQCTMDLRVLLDLWEKNKCKFSHPINQTLLISIEHNPHLQIVLREFTELNVTRTLGPDISIDGLETQMLAIEDKIKKYHNRETSLERLQKINYDGKIPAELVMANFYEEIMTHPIVMDKKYILCYWELKKYWETYPYQNPYTGRKFRSLSYDEETKTNIEAFILDPKKYCLNKKANPLQPSPSLLQLLNSPPPIHCVQVSSLFKPVPSTETPAMPPPPAYDHETVTNQQSAEAKPDTRAGLRTSK